VRLDNSSDREPVRGDGWHEQRRRWLASDRPCDHAARGYAAAQDSPPKLRRVIARPTSLGLIEVRELMAISGAPPAKGLDGSLDHAVSLGCRNASDVAHPWHVPTLQVRKVTPEELTIQVAESRPAVADDSFTRVDRTHGSVENAHWRCRAYVRRDCRHLKVPLRARSADPPSTFRRSSGWRPNPPRSLRFMAIPTGRRGSRSNGAAALVRTQCRNHQRRACVVRFHIRYPVRERAKAARTG
jgi:hypothetical protein